MQSSIYPNRAKAYKSMTMLVLRELTNKEKILNYEQAIGAVYNRDVEAEAEAGSGSGTFSVEAEAEARKFYRFRFHIGGKNGERKEIGSAILRRRANRRSINIKK